MNNRLKQFLAAENITQAQFADKINVVRASVSHILSGRNKPSFDFIKALMQQYPRLNIEWLVFGKGKMYIDSHTTESEQLFPIEIDPSDDFRPQNPPQETDDFVHESEYYENDCFSNNFNTLDKDIQHIVKQRKVSKIIIMFDDGTYQEL